MKDVVLLAVSVYLLKQDVVRASLPAVDRPEPRQVALGHGWAAGEPAAR